MPVISIVVPVFKVEQYLEKCITSIRNQTFGDLEIILVDDGSPDNCPAMCDEFARKDSRIKVIHQKNGGLSRARNAGINVATGQYICFVDSDDMMALDYCETLYSLLDKTEYDFSVCGTYRFTTEENIRPEHKGISGSFSNIEFLKLQLERKSEFGVWNKLFRKELFEKIRFASGKLHEDVIWSADLAKTCKNGVICTEKELYFYRQNQNGIVSQTSKRCSPDRVYAGEYLAQSIKKMDEPLYKIALKYAIDYPWMFIDPIYVHREFKENKQFLNSMKTYLKKYVHEYVTYNIFSEIQLKRMKLFSISQRLYTCNTAVRLLRLYLFKVLKKDPYKDGHGI